MSYKFIKVKDNKEVYDPPYNAEQIKQNYGKELYNKLKSDPVHAWRMQTGIELIHKEPTKEELERIWKNWQLMSDAQKEISDNKSIELFGIDNKTNYEKLIKEYKEIKDFKSPQDLLSWMKKNITYNLAEEEYDDTSEILTQSAEEILNSRAGHCAEQSYLELEVLKNLGYKCNLYFCKEDNSENSYGYEGSAHVFVVYEDNEELYYFENAMAHNRGIHEFDDIEEVFEYITENWWRYDKESDILEFREMKKPIVGINNEELAKECYKGKLLYTGDISNNILESEVETSNTTKTKDSVEEKTIDTNIELKEGNTIVGKAMIRDYQDGEIFLTNFEILPKFRGKGYGTKQLHILINKYGVNSLTVATNNDRAIHMYKKAGFKIIGKPYFDENANEEVIYMKLQ